MQNLTLPIQKNVSAKPAEDAIKSYTNQHVNENDATHDSFKHMLNQQVQAKTNAQNTNKQNQVKPNQNAAPKTDKPVNNQPSDDAKSDEITQAAQVSASQDLPNQDSFNQAAVAEAQVNNVKAIKAQKLAAQKLDQKVAGQAISDQPAADAALVSDGAPVDLAKKLQLARGEASDEANKIRSDKQSAADQTVNPLLADASTLAALMQQITHAPQAANDAKMTETTDAFDAEEMHTPSLDAALNQALVKNNGQAFADAAKNNPNKAGNRDALNPLQLDDNKASVKADGNAQDLTAAAFKLPAPTENAFKASLDQAQVLQRSQEKNDAALLSVVNSMQAPAQMQLATQASAALGSTNQIVPSFGTSAWDQAISQKVMFMVGAGEQSATLTLNPPDLGLLQVVIHVRNDQADTTFMSDNADVRQALQDGMDNLRDQLASSGLQLGQANVSAREQSQQGFQQATQNRSSAATRERRDENVVETRSQTSVRVNNGLVDTFV